MSDYLITTDNMTDLPDSYFQEHGLGVMSLTYMIDGKTYSKKNELPYKEFYAKMRAGSMPTTSQVNPDEAKEELKAFLERTNRLIHIAFSSGLSGSYNSARIAAEELMEENPDVKITVIDSLCASLGEGLLVHKAVMLKEQGMEYDELVSWIENNKLHMVHNFTVDDLFHLYRGGRVSKAAAILGTMVNLKPVLHVDDEGHLVPVSKVRGRKKSIAALVESMEKQIGSYRDKNDIVFISHGDCLEDAEYLRDMIREKLGIQEFLINPVGPTIGAHSGPGTLALFYMGDVR
ncbi:DegV family protein [Murimonas intestini]|uniref:DegV family protein n=1 Tax=Murimonas intestini TaxID=1337051 RepID=UPI0011DE0980|nr:DegV family protein [Murimonas intestini]